MSDQDLPGQFEMSIGGESIPFTMQAEVGHMTIDEVVASGFFDLPDKPGMVRIPVTINVMIPWHLLEPPGPPAADQELGDPATMADDEDDGQARRRHAVGAIAQSFGTMFGPAAAEDRAAFRDMLRAT